MKTNAKAKILDILKRMGSRGATTMELIHDTGNPAAARRVWDLQQEGHRIEKRDEGHGVFRWIYRGAPTPRPFRPKLTQTSLLDMIRLEQRS